MRDPRAPWTARGYNFRDDVGSPTWGWAEHAGRSRSWPRWGASNGAQIAIRGVR